MKIGWKTRHVFTRSAAAAHDISLSNDCNDGAQSVAYSLQLGKSGDQVMFDTVGTLRDSSKRCRKLLIYYISPISDMTVRAKRPSRIFSVFYSILGAFYCCNYEHLCLFYALLRRSLTYFGTMTLISHTIT